MSEGKGEVNLNEQLSCRLSSVFQLVEGANINDGRVVDVGSDHGQLASFCLFSKITNQVVCTDIHKAPAQRTRDRLIEDGFDGRFEVFCTDGLKGVELKKNDIVVMAGIGGNTIIDIIEAATVVTDEETLKSIRWCLQPQKSSEKLRKFLADSGFIFECEDIVIDRDIYYSMMRVRYCAAPWEISLNEMYFGPELLKEYDNLKIKADDSVDEGYEERFKLFEGYYKHLRHILKIRSQGNAEIRELLSQFS